MGLLNRMESNKMQRVSQALSKCDETTLLINLVNKVKEIENANTETTDPDTSGKS